MNNYCTNCGNRLNNKDLLCPNCKTPIIDIPQDYKYKSFKTNKTEKIIKIIIFSIIGLLIVAIVLNYIDIKIRKLNAKKLQTRYVLPFLKDYDGNNEYKISYSHSGKCIIGGNCTFGRGCDNGCEEYKYLDANECKAYYFNVRNKNEKSLEDSFTITVFNRNNIYGVVEGKNIYGIKDEK